MADRPAIRLTRLRSRGVTWLLLLVVGGTLLLLGLLVPYLFGESLGPAGLGPGVADSPAPAHVGGPRA